MGLICDFLDKKLYPNHDDFWDDKLFRQMILKHVSTGSRALDLGAGRGANEEMNFKAETDFVAGVDPDSAVLQNPFLHEAKVLQAPDYKIPYPDESFDVVFSNSVLEHVSDIESFFREVERVLAPGGVFLSKTPNQNHYVALIARLAQHWFHEYYNKLRGRQARDTFPTVYACNSKRDVLAVTGNTDLTVESFSIIEGRPEYLRIWAPLYILGFLYERIVNAFGFLETFRCVIFLTLRKQS